MAFQIALAGPDGTPGIVPQADITALAFIDGSTNPDSEVISSKTITIKKSDLTSQDYPFATTDQTTLLVSGILDKDYALQVTFTVVTNVRTYTVAYKFVTLGYANTTKRDRIKRYELDSTIEDKEQYKKDTLNINYFMIVANDRIATGDLIGSQKALDYIGDIILKDANSPFSY